MKKSSKGIPKTQIAKLRLPLRPRRGINTLAAPRYSQIRGNFEIGRILHLKSEIRNGILDCNCSNATSPM